MPNAVSTSDKQKVSPHHGCERKRRLMDKLRVVQALMRTQTETLCSLQFDSSFSALHAMDMMDSASQSMMTGCPCVHGSRKTPPMPRAASQVAGVYAMIHGI